MSLETLLNASEQVDVIALAESIAADPERMAPATPTASVVALALALRQSWLIVQTSAALVETLDLLESDEPAPNGITQIQLKNAASLARQMVRQQIADLRRAPPATEGTA